MFFSLLHIPQGCLLSEPSWYWDFTGTVSDVTGTSYIFNSFARVFRSTCWCSFCVTRSHSYWLCKSTDKDMRPSLPHREKRRKEDQTPISNLASEEMGFCADFHQLLVRFPRSHLSFWSGSSSAAKTFHLCIFKSKSMLPIKRKAIPSLS